MVSADAVLLKLHADFSEVVAVCPTSDFGILVCFDDVVSRCADVGIRLEDDGGGNEVAFCYDKILTAPKRRCGLSFFLFADVVFGVPCQPIWLHDTSQRQLVAPFQSWRCGLSAFATAFGLPFWILARWLQCFCRCPHLCRIVDVVCLFGNWLLVADVPIWGFGFRTFSKGI